MVVAAILVYFRLFFFDSAFRRACYRCAPKSQRRRAWHVLTEDILTARYLLSPVHLKLSGNAEEVGDEEEGEETAASAAAATARAVAEDFERSEAELLAAGIVQSSETSARRGAAIDRSSECEGLQRISTNEEDAAGAAGSKDVVDQSRGRGKLRAPLGKGHSAEIETASQLPPVRNNSGDITFDLELDDPLAVLAASLQSDVARQAVLESRSQLTRHSTGQQHGRGEQRSRSVSPSWSEVSREGLTTWSEVSGEGLTDDAASMVSRS